MAAIQLLTAVVLNFMQFWKTRGQGQNRTFLVAINWVVVAQVIAIGCNSTTLAKLIALSIVQKSTKAYLVQKYSITVEELTVFKWLVLHCGYAIVHSRYLGHNLYLHQSCAEASRPEVWVLGV